jgi:hypothetical protein
MDLGIAERGGNQPIDLVYLRLRETYGLVFNKWFAKMYQQGIPVTEQKFLDYLKEKGEDVKLQK